MSRKRYTDEEREDMKKSMQKYAKPVLQLNIYNNKVIARYESLHSASEITSISRRQISLAARGIAKTAGYFKWRLA